MLEEIIFYLQKTSESPLAETKGETEENFPGRSEEMKRACSALQKMGYRCHVQYETTEAVSEQLYQEDQCDKNGAEKQNAHTLYLTDAPEIFRLLRETGRYAAVYSHPGNEALNFPGAEYLLQEPEWIDADSWQKVYERQANLPWTILETEHCIVREFVPGDLESIYKLYDAQAVRFLTPPGEDREKEQRILEAYIQRIYRLYGFGNWAVLLKENGELIGRMGFAAVTAEDIEAFFTDSQNRNRSLKQPDASLGYLLDSRYRGRGLAEEVCRSLCVYGFEMLDFRRIMVRIHPENAASAHLAEKLGFRKQCGTLKECAKGEELYILERNQK